MACCCLRLQEDGFGCKMVSEVRDEPDPFLAMLMARSLRALRLFVSMRRFCEAVRGGKDFGGSTDADTFVEHFGEVDEEDCEAVGGGETC